MTIIIRPMTLDDLEQVHTIDTLSFSLPWPKNSYRFELLQNPGSSCLVAEIQSPPEASRIVGMIVTWNIVDEAHIATLAVHPEYRRQGIGEKLLAVVLEDAHRKGMKTATLEVRAQNTPAQALYQRFGFTVVGCRSRYYQDNQDDAIIMSLSSLEPEYLSRINSGGQGEG